MCAPQRWGHHRHGWGLVSGEMVRRLHSPFGMRFYDWADGFFRDGVAVRGLWSGFLHNVVSYPAGGVPGARILPLSRLVGEDFFRESLAGCVGLFTLCSHTRDYLASETGVPVVSLLHPGFGGCRFSWERFSASPRVVGVGQWMRRWDSLAGVSAGMPKYVLGGSGLAGVGSIPHLSAEGYDGLLASSAVYLDFHDVAACNVVVECIMSSTPLVVRDLPGTREYLGGGYPGLFTGSADGHFSMGRLRACHEYLLAKDKVGLSLGAFMDRFLGSEVYGAILGRTPRVWL